MTLELPAIRRAARETLGHRRLLPGQAEAIEAITSGRDTLALLPTGGGKSAIYQLAGVSIDGPTVVVSPLIALQRDQLDGLRELELPSAAINSTIPAGEREVALDAFATGSLEFLLLGPEQLADGATMARVRAGRPSLLVVDEAHCVAEWGRDFRPEYRRLGRVAEELGRPPILALTATASPLLREEILERLGMRDPVVVARGFDRPNITLDVESHADAASRDRALVATVADTSGTGIVYAGTRAATLELAASLLDAGVSAAPYHAGLGARRRAETQETFMAGDARVIVATIAFGMGIDKPDVRFVFHRDVSDSLDAYHQEIGRAGRDGEPAEARLFYRAEDLGLRRFQAAPATFDEDDVRKVVRALRRVDGGERGVETIAKAARLSRRRTDAIIGRLEELDAASTESDGRVTPGDDLDGNAIAAAAVAGQERRRAVERSRVEMIRGYAETTGCRRAFLLGYFGEPFEPPCGNCDRCLSGSVVQATASSVDSSFEVNARVVHAMFGPGLVTAVDGARVTVAFENVGYRTLDATTATDNGALVAAD